MTDIRPTTANFVVLVAFSKAGKEALSRRVRPQPPPRALMGQAGGTRLCPDMTQAKFKRVPELPPPHRFIWKGS